MSNKHLIGIISLVVIAVLAGGAWYWENSRFKEIQERRQQEQRQVVPSEENGNEKTSESGSSIITTTTAEARGYSIELTITSMQSEDEYQGKKVQYEWIASSSLRIYKDNKIVYRLDDTKFWVSSPPDEPITEESLLLETAQEFLTDAMKDFTKDNIPELGFIGFSGGAHCCGAPHIISLGQNFNLLLDDVTRFDGRTDFVDLDQDGVIEAKINSITPFDYWHTGYANSPATDVILSFNSERGKYMVNTALMRISPPSEAEIKAQASGWTAEGWEGKRATAPWRYALALVFSGNAESARKYIDLAWRDNSEFKSKEAFLDEFTAQIEESQFYPELASFLSLESLSAR